MTAHLDMAALGKVLKHKYRNVGPFGALVGEMLEFERGVLRRVAKRDRYVFFEGPVWGRWSELDRITQYEVQAHNRATWSIEYDRDGIRIALSFEIYADKKERVGGAGLAYVNSPFFAMLRNGGPIAKPEPKPTILGWLEITKYDNASRMDSTSTRYTDAGVARDAIAKSWSWWLERWGQMS